MEILVLGPGCPKCKAMYSQVVEALQQTGIKADLRKVEDIEEMMTYNVLTTPVLMIDGAVKVKGRVPDMNEIKEFLTNS